MKILHINDVANVGATLVEGLCKLGQEAELRRMHLVAGKRSTAVKLLVSPLRLAEMLSINKQVRNGHYDIVHIHFAYLGWMGILGRYPFYLHVHGSDVRRDLGDRLRRWAIIQSLKRAKSVFFVTPDLAPYIHSFRPDSTFLPDPINIDRFVPIQGKQGGPVRLLIISRLSAIKKVGVAFEAVKLLCERYREVEVTAIDQGPERDVYIGTPGVKFIRPVPYQEMPALIQEHDIVIGQFGLGILSMAELESMACGKPVVCFFKYGEWYPDNPPVYSTDQTSRVVDYLSILLENPELRRQFGQQGRDWVERNHGYRKMSQRLVDAYQTKNPEGYPFI